MHGRRHRSVFGLLESVENRDREVVRSAFADAMNTFAEAILEESFGLFLAVMANWIRDEFIGLRSKHRAEQVWDRFSPSDRRSQT